MSPVTAPGAPLLDALARFASGVTVVTTRDSDGCPHGVTATAFCSLSLDPPLVMFCLARAARSHGAFVLADRYAIHVLRGDQAEVAAHFGRSHQDKFRDQPWRSDEHGLPEIHPCLARIVCEPYEVHHAGDHSVVIGAVRGVVVSDGEPLLYFVRRYWLGQEFGMSAAS